MMKKNLPSPGIFLTAILFCFATSLAARFVPGGETPYKKYFPVAVKDSLKLKNKNFFMSVGITPIFELMSMKAKVVDFSYTYNNVNYDTITYRESGGVTLIAVTYEFRYNLYTYLDKGSVSVSSPVAISLNFFESEGRFFSFTAPVIFDLNYGMHSTFNNIDRFGGHIGVGYQAIVGGIFSEGYGRGKREIWTQPVVRAGGKFPFRKKNCFFDVYWGFGKNYQALKGFEYNNEPVYETVHSKLYFKAVFGWLINYE